jgi:energy-coupling factor transporter transmembrane protein EcfT
MIARGFDPAARPRQSLPLTRADVTALVAVPALVLASRLVPLLAGLP